MKRIGLALLLVMTWVTLSSWSAPGSVQKVPVTYPQGRLTPLMEGWMYHWSGSSCGSEDNRNESAGDIAQNVSWEPYHLQQPLRPDGGKLLWLKKTLNEASLSGAALFIPQYSCFRAFEVYLGDVKIYQSGELSPAFANRHLYIKWHLIPLPSDYFNQTLRFRFFSDHPRLIGLVSAIYLGEVSSILSHAVLRDLDITVLGLLMIFGGLIAAALLIAHYRLKNNALLCFSIMAVSAGIYSLTESSVTSLRFDHPVLQSYLHYVTFFIFLGGLSAFMEQTVEGSQKRFYRLGALFQIAYLFLAVLLDLLEILPWDTTFNAGMVLLAAGIVAAELGLLKMALAGDFEARILCLGYGLLGLSGVWDILAGLQIVSPQKVVFPWGLVFLLISLGMVLILRYRADRLQAEEAIRRSEERFRNLFENAPISILEVDFKTAQPLVICANTPATEIFGLAAEEPLSLPLERFFPPASISVLRRAMDSLGAATHTALQATCLGAGNVEFAARIGASLTQMFGLGRVVLTLEDITEEKERRSEEEAIAEERRRIAREIHDGLAQDLAFMNLRASVWHRLVDGRPEQMCAEISLFQQLLKKNMLEVRRCIFALRPVDLEELGFFEATRRFLREFGEQGQIEVSFEVVGCENDLPHRLEPVLFRIIQESLNNVRKHARAKTVRLHLEIAVEGSVRLDLQDDGVGFDTELLERAFRDGHLGLKQMRERVAKQRGSFTIESGGGRGTRIQVSLPLTV